MKNVLIATFCLAMLGSAYSAEPPKTKKVCHIVKLEKSGKTVEQCKVIKIHKKLEGTKVPSKK
jgi:hypothetical protein